MNESDLPYRAARLLVFVRPVVVAAYGVFGERYWRGLALIVGRGLGVLNGGWLLKVEAWDVPEIGRL